MKKKFTINNLECGHCASKIEDAINKLASVTSASLNFMTQRLTIEAGESNFDEVMKEVVAVAKKIEPGCEVVLK